LEGLEGKEILFVPKPEDTVARTESHFRDKGVRFTWWDDHQTLSNRLRSRSPFLLVMDLPRIGESRPTMLGEIETCLNECKAIVFGADNHPHTGARKPVKGIVYFQDLLDASVFSAALSRILTDGWDCFQRNCILSNPYHLFFSHGPKMEAIRAVVDQIAPTDITPLIQGETGTGKKLLAQAIHSQSLRRDRPFLSVNCASIPGELLEGELFGFDGVVTAGAYTRMPGKIELASGGTVFLDEIGDMDMALQEKLFRVLQDKTFSRQGGEGDIPVTARVIAATTSDLENAMKSGLFREDLYHYLHVVRIVVPPLRERKEEIPSVAACFFDRYNARYGRSYPGFSEETEKVFLGYHWPGNVTELQRAVKQIVVSQNEAAVVREIAEQGAPPTGTVEVGRDRPSPEPGGATLRAVGRKAAREAERAVIQKMLGETRWNRRKAAGRLQISYKALLYKIREYGLDQ